MTSQPLKPTPPSKPLSKIKFENAAKKSAPEGIATPSSLATDQPAPASPPPCAILIDL